MVETHAPSVPRLESAARDARTARWVGGGTDGNERLTSTTGAVLIVLLAVLGLTILRIHPLLVLGLALAALTILEFSPWLNTHFGHH